MRRFAPKLSYSPHRYIPELDGVRGLAILLVMLYHCFPSPLTGAGWVGVDLFFVLSGFLITGILLDSRGSSKYYVNFIGRRVLRIFPLYYFILFIMLFLIPTLWGSILPPHFGFYIQHQSWFWSYLQNWLYSIHGFPKSHLLVHFWSLGVEEQFYLVWPLIVLFMPGRYLMKVSVFLCVVAIVFRLLPLEWLHFEQPYRYLNTLSRMDALLIGAIMAQLVRKNKKVLEKMAIPTGIIGLIVFLIGIVITRSLSFLNLSVFYTALDLFMGMILFLSLSNTKWMQNILRRSPLTFLGKYSYGLYVYHYIIYILLMHNLDHWLHDSFSSFLTRMLFLGGITIALSLVISVLSYHLFEVHFLKLKVYFRNGPKRSGNKNTEIPPLKASATAF